MKDEKKVEDSFEGEQVLSIKKADEKFSFWKPKKVGEILEGKLTAIAEGRFGKVLKISTRKGTIAIAVNAFLEDIDFTQYADERLRFEFKGVVGRGCRLFDVSRVLDKDAVPF